MPDVVVVGSCNQDLVAYSEKLPRPGETITGSRFEMGFGGKGANQAVMASKMGAKTQLIAKLGTDLFGDSYMKNLEAVGMDTAQVLRTSEASTGVALINVAESSGANVITIVSGANGLLTPEDVAAAGPAIASAKVLVCQLEVCQDTTEAALQQAREAGVTTIFNPAPAPASLLDGILPLCDIVCPNETEMDVLLGGGVDVEDLDSVCKGASALLDKGCKHVVVTLGSRGALWATRESSWEEELEALGALAYGEAVALRDRPSAEGMVAFHFPPQPVAAIDTVGAGDAFLGALAAHLSQGMRIGEAIPLAGGVAGISTTAAGAQSSYPAADQLPPPLRMGVDRQKA